MADIGLRFHKDMLVLSTPVVSSLKRSGVNVERDLEFLLLIEPDTLEDIYRLESIAGAQCFVTCTSTITPARLMRVGMEDRAQELAHHALEAVSPFDPQHILVEIGPCGLPLDGASQNSLKENFDQYARAGRLFEHESFDAFFINGFTTCTDLKCALMGLRQVSDRPIFASVDVRDDGMLVTGRETLEQAFDVMNEYGAQVGGFETAAPQDGAVALAQRAAKCSNLALLVQLEVYKGATAGRLPHMQQEFPYEDPDSMMDAADALWATGVQFLRAIGDATPAYTGALVASTMGRDVQGVFDDDIPALSEPKSNN